jgi:hypothetical protein
MHGGDIPSLSGRESTTMTEKVASGSESLISSHASVKTCSTTDDLAKVTTTDPGLIFSRAVSAIT